MDEKPPSPKSLETLVPGGAPRKPDASRSEPPAPAAGQSTVATLLGVPTIREPGQESGAGSAKEDEEEPAHWMSPLAMPDAPPEPPPTVPVQKEEPGPEEDAPDGIPRGKPRFLLPVFGGLGLLLVILLGGLAVKALRAPSRTMNSTPIATTKPPESEVAPVAPAVVDADAGAAPVSSPCTVVGASKMLAPRILLPSGVEVMRAPQGIALGFAAGPKDAAALVVDPRTLDVVARGKATAHGAIRRVLPVPSTKAVGVALENERKGDRLQGRRAVAGAPFDMGVAKGHVAWARHGSGKSTALWPLQGKAPVEAIRASPLEGTEGGYAVAFRHGDRMAFGTVDAKFAAKGELAYTLGPQVGSPAMAASGDVVALIWASRATASDAWRLQWQRWRQGEAAPEPAKNFEPPSGGLGAPLMSPSIAGLGDGRFLVVWAEGPFANHQVRALTIDAKGEPEGPALSISADGVNAGQGQVLVSETGHGLVAYLAASGSDFELWATPVSCPR
ncbi:hypothetical protein LVJ94_03080 [Pendulispora rubella]|uniref:Uncharacterized protein n=1 Tax=Pendulispora rubella TaxID=2741070 RepID=A0ABZ2L5L8_9BACT